MYTLIFRKGTVELEFSTDDKFIVERQLEQIIKQASGNKSNTTEQIQSHVKEECAPQDLILQKEDEVPKVQTAVFEKITQEEEKSIVHNEDIVPNTIDVMSVKPLTINSLQNPVPTPEPDFDKILNNELNIQHEETPVLKDEKFINYIEGKSALEKLDFLVITAQYLAQYENMNLFNLKHINAKLMQNFTIIVDHSVLQSAISREYITRIQEGSDDFSSEYMLTEKGLRSY